MTSLVKKVWENRNGYSLFHSDIAVDKNKGITAKLLE